MRRTRSIHIGFRTTFCLIVAVASMLAPYKTSLARLPVQSLPHQHTRGGLVRVRAVTRDFSQADSRASVGLSKGNGIFFKAPLGFARFVRPSVDSRLAVRSGGQVALKAPHLRC